MCYRKSTKFDDVKNLHAVNAQNLESGEEIISFRLVKRENEN